MKSKEKLSHFKNKKDKLLNTGEKNGSTRQALTKALLERFEINYPSSLNEQKIVVDNINEILEKTKKLESIYRQKIADLDELKKSLLQKAFAGEL